MIERFPRDAFVALGLAPVRGLHQEAQLDRPHLRLIHALPDFVARAHGPGEVVDVVAVIGQGLGVVRIADFSLDQHAAGADDFILRHRELHVVDAEVGEELGGGVILVAIPGSVPPDAYFRKPLAAKHEIALPSGARLRLGKLVWKAILNCTYAPGAIGLASADRPRSCRPYCRRRAR